MRFPGAVRGPSLTIRAFLVATTALTMSQPVFAADINVTLDQAKLVKLPANTATIVIGNPLIADAAVQPGSQMVVTGKGYGTTNLIVLDRAGAVQMEKSIEVHGPHNAVVVYRGAERETYNCTPVCERRITLGDTGAFFDTGISQISSRNGSAQGAVQPGK